MIAGWIQTVAALYISKQKEIIQQEAIDYNRWYTQFMRFYIYLGSKWKLYITLIEFMNLWVIPPWFYEPRWYVYAIFSCIIIKQQTYTIPSTFTKTSSLQPMWIG